MSAGPLLGLRVRLVLAMLATSALTVAVVTLALLSPLQRRLRNDELEGLRAASAVVRVVLQPLPRSELRPESRRLDTLVRVTSERIDAQVVLVAPDGRELASSVTRPGPRLAAALAALRHQRTIVQIIEEGGSPLAMHASTGRANTERIGFAVSKRLDEVDAAVRVVRNAVLAAALVGLAASLLLGLPLASRLVRRLRDLRDTVLRIARLGPVVEMTPDHARDEIGDLSRAFATMQDRLRQQEEARRTFVSTASHELRTPLSALQLTLDLAREELVRRPTDLDAAAAELERAGNQAARLGALADQLLDLSRVDAGIGFETEPVDVVPITAAVLREFSARAAAHDMPLRLEAEGAAWAMADAGAVVQILRIALDNALRFQPAGEPLTVEIAGGADGCVVRIRDRGPGIPAEEREVVFERFRRGRHTGGDGGFGLGLAIGRELARGMGGELALADVGVGTCLELRLRPAPSPR